MTMAGSRVTPARHHTPKHRILRSVPDLHQDSHDSARSGPVESHDLQMTETPIKAVPATSVEDRRHTETIKRLEQLSNELQGRLMVLRGQATALADENISLRARLFNLEQAEIGANR